MSNGVTYIPMSERTGSIPVNTVIKTTETADGQVQHVNVDTSALPSGAATSDNQTNGTQVSKILFDPSNM